jgi:hypothetical protein
MQSQILKRWSKAHNYTGEDFSDCYVVSSFTRDSNVYEVANFIAIASYLMDVEPESEKGWQIVRFGHWKHGYLFSILVHKNSPLVALCEALVQTLHENPVFDEDVLNECEDLIQQIANPC